MPDKPFIKICTQCQKEYTVRFRTNRKKSKFCSRECFQKFSTIPPEIRFWKKVIKTDYCWIWNASVNKKGYGTFPTIAGNTAHRFSYYIHFGQIPKGLMVCHHCDNPPCVNPSHLFIGTNNDNIQDAKFKNRLAKGDKSGAHKHPERLARGSKVGTSVLKEDDIPRIREFNKTIGYRKIAKIFNVGDTTIRQIINGKTWKHVI